jgi:hypothetical protein
VHATPSEGGAPEQSGLESKGGRPAEGATADVRWESCQIDLDFVNPSPLYGNLGIHSVRFVAAAEGPGGTYTAGVTPAWDTYMTRYIGVGRNSEIDSIFDGLVEQLVRDGWELIRPGGTFWYSARFRRQSSA